MSVQDQSKSDGVEVQRSAGCLPAWQEQELPAPLPFTFRNVLRTIGPGAILLAGSIGGGEWIVGPLTTVRYGTGILWVATVGIFLQMIFNLEAIRYTLYTGEPILTGIMRLRPGRWVWGPFYIAAGTLQLATPALALGCANVLFTAGKGALPDPGGTDRGVLLALSLGVLALTVVLLQCGKSIERMLERLSWAMVIFIFVFLIAANVLFVPADIWRWGLCRPVICRRIWTGCCWVSLQPRLVRVGWGILRYQIWSAIKAWGWHSGVDRSEAC
jgi:hypothetical protein